MATRFSYRFNWERFLDTALPITLRTRTIKMLFRCGYEVMDRLILEPFALARNEDRFTTSHNGQVVYLQKALNEHFRSNNRASHFRVADVGSQLIVRYAYDEYHSNVTYAHNQEARQVDHLYAVNVTKLKQGSTFVIRVPRDIYFSRLSEVKRFVNRYRLITRVPIYEPTS